MRTCGPSGLFSECLTSGKMGKGIAMTETDDQFENEARPWECHGAVRRDCEPHRGVLLKLIGIASMVFGMVSLFGVPGILALALGIYVHVAARSDTRKMVAGLMDPAGARELNLAKGYAKAGIALAICNGAMLILIVFMSGLPRFW